MPTRRTTNPLPTRTPHRSGLALLTCLVLLLGSHGSAQGWGSTHSPMFAPLTHNTSFTMQRTQVIGSGWHTQSTTTMNGTTTFGNASYDTYGTGIRGRATVMLPGYGTAFGTSTSTVMGGGAVRTTSTWMLPDGRTLRATSRSTPTGLGGTRTSNTWSSYGTGGSFMGSSSSYAQPSGTMGIRTTTFDTGGFGVDPLNW